MHFQLQNNFKSITKYSINIITYCKLSDHAKFKFNFFSALFVAPFLTLHAKINNQMF